MCSIRVYGETNDCRTRLYLLPTETPIITSALEEYYKIEERAKEETRCVVDAIPEIKVGRDIAFLPVDDEVLDMQTRHYLLEGVLTEGTLSAVEVNVGKHCLVVTIDSGDWLESDQKIIKTVAEFLCNNQMPKVEYNLDIGDLSFSQLFGRLPKKTKGRNIHNVLS